MMDTIVDILIFAGCPNVDATVERVRRAIATAKVPAEIRIVRVESDEDAKRLRFLGSPTVRVAGVDVDPRASERDDFGLQSRIYATGGRLEGVPPTEWVEAALRVAWYATLPSTAPRYAAALGATHIVFGHQPSALRAAGEIATGAGGTLFRIDCCMSPDVNDSDGRVMPVHTEGDVDIDDSQLDGNAARFGVVSPNVDHLAPGDCASADSFRGRPSPVTTNP